MDSDVSCAQLVPDHPLITDHAFHLNAKKIKSSDLTCFAHNVNGAQLDLFQTQLEPPVSSSQDHQLTLEESQAALNTRSSTLTELSVFHAQTIH